jgi:hypothetical protein
MIFLRGAIKDAPHESDLNEWRPMAGDGKSVDGIVSVMRFSN